MLDPPAEDPLLPDEVVTEPEVAPVPEVPVLPALEAAVCEVLLEAPLTKPVEPEVEPNV